MSDIFAKILVAIKKVKWVELGLVALFGLTVLGFAKKFGDVVALFLAWLLLRFIVGKLKK